MPRTSALAWKVISAREVTPGLSGSAPIMVISPSSAEYVPVTWSSPSSPESSSKVKVPSSLKT